MFLFHRDCVVNILFFRQHMDTLQTHLIHKPETSLIYDTRCVACNKKCIYRDRTFFTNLLQTNLFVLKENYGFKLQLWFSVEHDDFNLFCTMVFLYTLKTSENQSFFDVFRVYRKRPVTWNRLISGELTIQGKLVSLHGVLLWES